MQLMHEMKTSGDINEASLEVKVFCKKLCVGTVPLCCVKRPECVQRGSLEVHERSRSV